MLGGVQITHVIVHEPDQARGIIREALRIADEFENDELSRLHIFREACALLGQRWTFTMAQEASAAIQLPVIDGLRR